VKRLTAQQLKQQNFIFQKTLFLFLNTFGNRMVPNIINLDQKMNFKKNLVKSKKSGWNSLKKRELNPSPQTIIWVTQSSHTILNLKQKNFRLLTHNVLDKRHIYLLARV